MFSEKNPIIYFFNGYSFCVFLNILYIVKYTHILEGIKVFQRWRTNRLGTHRVHTDSTRSREWRPCQNLRTAPELGNLDDTIWPSH